MRKKSKGRVKKFDEENNLVEFKKRDRETLARVEGLDGYDTFDPDRSFDVDDFIREGLEKINDDNYEYRGNEAGKRLSEGQDRRYKAEEGSQYVRAGKRSAGEDDYDAIALKRAGKETGAAPKKKRKKNPQKRRRMLIYGITILILLLAIAMPIRKIVVLKMEERQLLAEQRALERQKEELEKELTRVNDAEYIEEQARKQLNLIKPGETLYLLPEDEEGGEE